GPWTSWAGVDTRAVGETGPRNGAGDAAAALSAWANSGKEESGCQAPPSLHANVCPLARPSLIHTRMSSAETGPYSFRSAPRILYMGRGSLEMFGPSSMPAFRA